MAACSTSANEGPRWWFSKIGGDAVPTRCFEPSRDLPNEVLPLSLAYTTPHQRAQLMTEEAAHGLVDAIVATFFGFGTANPIRVASVADASATWEASEAI